MRTWIQALALITILVAGCASAVGLEREVVFTAQDIQAAIDKSPTSATLLDGRVTVALQGSPVFTLGDPPHRVGVLAHFTVQALGARPVPVRMKGSANVVYNEKKKAFFIDAPVVDTVQTALIPEALEGLASQAITQQLAAKFSANPVYTLNTDKNQKERTVATYLKSIEIRKDAVVARFALQ